MLSAYWPYILVALVLLVLGTALLIYLLLRGARKRAAAAQGTALSPVVVAAESPARQHSVSSLGLKSSFARAVRLLRTHVTRRDYRYRLPWLLAVGEADSGKTTLLSETGLGLPLGRPAEQPHGVKQGVNWFFFDRGVVLDVAGDFVLRPDGEPSNRRGWREIARLLQKYRPERPLDGVVLTIPCTDLVAARGLDGRARIEQKAATLYRKLWQAQKVLGMSFPVYVIVTKCDEIAGFRSLCRELPAHAREQMFGWSSPYTLETAYRPEWIEEAFQNVYRYLFQVQVEVFAERGDVQDPDALFMLPSEMQALKAPLQLYLDHVFKESSFHDSFFLRGLYFCGDAGDDPARAVAPVQAPTNDDWLAASPDPFAPLAPAPAAAAARKPAFLKDLFEKKIFPEDMLARPVVKTSLSRNRTALVCQVLALAVPIIGLLGLLTTYAGLERRRDELYNLLRREEQDLREVENKELRERRGRRPRATDFYSDSYHQSSYVAPNENPASAVRAQAVRAQDAALLQPAAGYTEAQAGGGPATTAQAGADATQDNEAHLLSAMAKADVKNYYSVFIPSSWFSDLDERTDKSLVAAFHYVILDDLRLSLEERADDFLQAAPIYDYAPNAYPPAPDLPRTGFAPPASAAPTANATGARDADAPGARGAQPGAQPDARQPAPDARAPLPDARARGAAPVYDQPFSAGADATLHGLIERFGELRAARARYETLITPGSGSVEDLKALSLYLGHSWPQEGFDSNNELYRHALEQARGEPLKPGSAEVQRAFAARVAEMVEVLYDRSFERQAGGVRYDYLGDIKQTEALLARPEHTWLATYVFDPRSPFHDMTLSSGLAELHRALDGLARQSFMAAGSPYGATPPKVFARRQLIWDTASLQQAVSLCGDYERFAGARSTDPSTSRSLDDSVQQAALAQLRANVASLVARAQRYETAAHTPGESAMRASLNAEVKSFQQAEDPLAQLLDATTRLGIDVGLRPALNSQATYLVGAINREFVAGRFYATARPDFSWWDGTKPVSSPAFSADGPDDLAAYLAAQRKQIAFLARELAAPVYSFLSSQNIPAQAMRADSRVDWDDIITELDAYDNKQPGNSVAVLEDFIRVGMDKADVGDCDAVVRVSPNAPARDFFIQTRDHLRRLLYRQCVELARQKTYEDSLRAADDALRTLDNYREIEDTFNRTLAGRYPFADAPTGVPLAEAEPEAVLAFFRLLDKKEAAARDALKRNPQLGAEGDEASAFLDRMGEVRTFFTAYLDKKLGPFVDFNVRFRVNRDMERGGGQIIDWTLDVGRKKYRYLDQELSGRWLVGEPVRLTLRWANNSPSVPFATADTPTFRVRDRVVVFEFKNRWSLLSLMSRHGASASDFKYHVDTEPYTLKFRVPTRPDGNLPERQPEELRPEEADAFMSLSLVAPGGKDPLLLPAFPARAPKL